MLSRMLPAVILIGAGVIVVSANGDTTQNTRNIDPALLVGIAGPLCLKPPGNAVDNRLFYKIAAASKNELNPYGQLPKAEQQSPSAGEPPLWDNLGTLSFKVTTSKPLAQQYFNQGLRLAYAFNHDEAARAFRMAQKIDPSCAMCYWGEALVLGPNINMPMNPEAVAPAVAARNKAIRLMKRSTPREQALIRALAARYSPDPNADRAQLDVAYADAMKKVVERFPRDENVGVLYAESLMNISPWDYWEAGGAKPKGRTAELVATLERVLKANPNHPGAIHYYIHTVEASTDPKRAEPYAERLGIMWKDYGTTRAVSPLPPKAIRTARERNRL